MALDERHMQAISWLMQGTSQAVIADRLGVSQPTVSSWKNRNAEFAQELERRQAALGKEMQDVDRAWANKLQPKKHALYEKMMNKVEQALDAATKPADVAALARIVAAECGIDRKILMPDEAAADAATDLHEILKRTA